MLIEGVAFGLVLTVLINGLNIFNYSYNYIYEDYFLNFYYSLGAGIWEEVLFRLVFFNSFFIILNNLNIKKYFNYTLSILISSLLFSLFHYYGSFADVFSYYTFAIRIAAGIILCLIYINRGLGITCITHYIYDVMLITIPILK